MHVTQTFPNGYGASVINYGYGANRGLWEVAVIGQDGSVCYDTPIADDVIGHLNENEVTKVIEQIANLPKPSRVISALKSICTMGTPS